jgi:cytochrome c oxidase assembly protein subunit 23
VYSQPEAFPPFLHSKWFPDIIPLMPLTRPPPPPPKPEFDEFSTPPDFNDKFKEKETTKYMNPCQLEEKQSMKCLDKNNYDKSKCEYFFLQYRECKKQWVSWVDLI